MILEQALASKIGSTAVLLRVAGYNPTITPSGEFVHLGDPLAENRSVIRSSAVVTMNVYGWNPEVLFQLYFAIVRPYSSNRELLMRMQRVKQAAWHFLQSEFYDEIEFRNTGGLFTAERRMNPDHQYTHGILSTKKAQLDGGSTPEEFANSVVDHIQSVELGLAGLGRQNGFRYVPIS